LFAKNLSGKYSKTEASLATVVRVFPQVRWILLLTFWMVLLYNPATGRGEDPSPFSPWPELKEGEFPRPTSSDFRLHLSEERGYGESFFLQAFNGEGEVLIAVLSATNYNPLEKFGQSVDLYYAPPDGPGIIEHDERKGKELREHPDGWVEMGPHRVRFTAEGGRMIIRGKRLRAEIEFQNFDTPTRHGKGVLPFSGKRYWALFLQAPWTEVRARLDGEVKKEFVGYGYVDHGYATEMVPDFSQEWHRIRAYDPRGVWGLSIFQIIPDKKYKERTPFYTVAILKERKLKVLTSRCILEPLQPVEDERSGYRIPSRYRFAIETDSATLRGEVLDLRRKIEVDVLASLNWFTRTVVKTFFANPWQYLSLGKVKVSGAVLGEPVDAELDALVSAEYYD